jgi:uncharacterized membrane protein YedE/YeeE
MRPPRPYADPYLAGIGVGLALLAAFALAGRGLGASGAFASAVTAGVQAAMPAHAEESAFFGAYLGGRGGPLGDWLVLEIAGVTIGAFLSALLAGRMRLSISKGPRVDARRRIAFAFAGGGVMGFGAMLARGCTSGQALTGGALLSAGSWLFIGAAFAAAYAAAPLFRRMWT